MANLLMRELVLLLSMTAPPEEPTSGAASGGETHTLSRTLRHQAKPFSLPPSQRRLASSTVAQHHRVGNSNPMCRKDGVSRLKY